MGGQSEYERIRSNCQSTGELWVDPDFTASQSSLFSHGKHQINIVWKRPKELVIEPEFIVDTQPFDIVPGKLGDNWLVQCLRCLYRSKGLLYRAVPADQGFHHEDDYCGVFRFRIWWLGSWREVVVDDRLPCIGNKLVFLSSHRLHTFWAPLLEKAYAKLHGSYEALKYGSVLEGLADLTGGVVETLPLRDEATLTGRVLLDLLNMSSLVTATVQTDNNNKTGGSNEKLANGINVGTNYRLYSIDKVATMSGEIVQLVHLDSGDRNAYVGTWGPTSTLWDEVSLEERGRLGLLEVEQGEFWMSYADFMRTFTHLEVVHLDMETARDEPSLLDKDRWNMRLYTGNWQRGVTAGGCRNYTESFHQNPQLQLTVGQQEDVILCLTQHSVSNPKVIGFTGYTLSTSTDSLGKSYFKSARSLLNSQYTNSRHVSLRCNFSGSSYVILPTTFEPAQESSFTFRVLCRGSVKLKAVDSIPALLKSPILRAPDSLKDSKGYEQYETLFMRLSDERKTVNSFDLQELLETCLPNDYIKSMASLDICRQIVATMEKDKSSQGRLTYTSFKDLIVSLKMWQGVFRSHTREKTGVLKAERLRDALLEVGFRTSNEILSHILLRYIRKDGTLRFGDFVSIILTLTVAFGWAEKKDAAKQGHVKLSVPELVRASLASL